MTSDDEDWEFGELRFRVGDDPSGDTLAVDRLACDRSGLLYLLGVVGPQGLVKGLRAALNAPKVKATFELTGVRATDGNKSGNSTRLYTQEGRRFTVHPHPLDYGQVHAMFVSTDPGFLRVVSDESLFAELKQTTYTTPILRSWVPGLRDALTARGQLNPLFCFRCRCALVSATDADLDDVVGGKVKDGTFQFRELNLVGGNP